MDNDKIIADYVRMFHPEILCEPKYAVIKSAYPQIEQTCGLIADALQAVAEAIQPALGAIADAIIEQEKQKKEDENETLR